MATMQHKILPLHGQSQIGVSNNKFALPRLEGSVLKRRLNARCTAVRRLSFNELTNAKKEKKILCCILAILISTDALAVAFKNFRTSSFKYYVDHSHTMCSSGNTDVKN
jgi:hypothetical protein